MKNLLKLMLMVMAGIVICSCDDDKSTIPPTFKGFTCNPNPAHPGDTMVVRLHYASKGEYVHSPRCTWTLSLDTLNSEGVSVRATLSKKISASIGSEYLSCPFIIPENAVTGKLMTCKVDISFDNSVDTKPGLALPNPTQEGYMGSMGNSIVASTLYSKFNGSFSVGIVARSN